MPRSGKNTVTWNIQCKLNIKSENGCNSILTFIGFAIESIPRGPPFPKVCVTLVHTNVFAGQRPTFPTIKPIKIYTFRKWDVDHEKDEERPYLNHLRKNLQLLL